MIEMNSLRDGRVKKDVVMMASCYRYGYSVPTLGIGVFRRVTR